MDGGDETTTQRRCNVFNLKIHLYLCLLVTRQIIHNTLIMVNRYLRLMGDKTIPDSVEPCLGSFNPPFVASIDLDSYNL